MARLTDGMITKVAGGLPLREITLAAVIHMGAKYSELDNLKTTCRGNDQEMIRTIIRNWRNRTVGTPQKLAKILNVATTMDKKDIKTHLKVEQLFTIDEKKPTDDANLEEWELARVAKRFNKVAMENIARTCDTLTDAQIANIRSDKEGDSAFQSFEILKNWSVKNPDNNRQKLIDLLDKEEEAEYTLTRELLVKGYSSQDSIDSGNGGQGASPKQLENLALTDNNPKRKAPGSAHGSKNIADPTGSGIPSKRRRLSPKGIYEGSVRLDEEFYPMTSKLPGYVLIFNNEEFEGNKDREGTDKDAQGLFDVFDKRGFKVVEEKDLSAEDMTIKIRAFVKKDTLRSREQIKDFLKETKLNKNINEEKEKLLVELESKAFEEFRKQIKVSKALKEKKATLREKLTLIDQKRKEMDEALTPKQKRLFKNKFNLSNGQIKKIDEPLTKAEKDTLLHGLSIGTEEIDSIETFMNKMKGKDEDQSIDLKKTDCSVVVFMSHGGNGYIKDKHEKIIDIKKLINEFTSDNCEDLADKPKAFLIQACRGGRTDDAKTDDDEDEEIEAVPDYIMKGKLAIPRYADIIVGYASSSGQVSFRYEDYGTVFIEEFCDVVDACGDDMDMLAMTTQVNKLVAARKIYRKKKRVKQMSEFTHSLRKTWKLPKIR